jgi:hypothetical protein
MSVVPPGGYGTIRRTVLVGYEAANTAAGAITRTASATAKIRNNLAFMMNVS